MFYVIPSDELEKTKFDAYVEGVLLDKNDELAINIFISGDRGNGKASNLYKIKTDPKFSEIGMIRDRLVTMVHNSPILIVSEKFKQILSRGFPHHAEFYPVEFDQVNKTPLTGHYICNLIQKYDCTDYENSSLDYHFYTEDNVGYGGIYTIDSLAIDESKLPSNVHLFLLDNINTPVIIASKKMKNEIAKNNITGFKFIKPEDFMI